jgi:hypothetical protein
MSDTPPPRRIAPESGPHLWSAEKLSPADWMIPLGREMPDGSRLDALLGRLAERLTHGLGFALLRGLPAQQDAAALLDRLATGLGEPVAVQEGSGPFLTPACDMLLLLCQQGGTVALRSAAAVHNALLKADRAALEVLYRPLPASDELELPVFAVSQGVFAARLDRPAIAAATPSSALAALDAVLDSPGLALSLPLRPGDLLCVNPFLCWTGRMPGLLARGVVSRTDSRLAAGAFAGLGRG